MLRFSHLGKPATGKLDFTAQIRSGYSVDKVESGIAHFQVWTFDNGVTDVSIMKKKILGHHKEKILGFLNPLRLIPRSNILITDKTFWFG